MDSLLVQWGTLVGVAALIAVIINVLKLAGVIQDGTAQNWSAGLNLVGLVILFVLKIVRPDIDVEEIDKQAGALAEVAVVLIGYISQLLTSKLTHIAIRDVPIIGTSYSSER